MSSELSSAPAPDSPSALPYPVHADEAARLAALARYGLTGSSPQERFSRIARLAARILGTPVGLVTLLSDTYQDFIGTAGTELTGTDRSVALCSYTVAGDAPNLVPDLRDDPRYAANPLVTGDLALRAYAGVPIHSREGLPVGALCAIDMVPRTFSDEDRTALLDLSALAAEEIERTLDAQRLAQQQADLAARSEAEVARDVVERRLGAVLDALQAGVIIADAAGRLTHINQAALRIFGGLRASENVEDYGEWEGYWPETGARVQAHEWTLARALEQGAVIAGESIDIVRFDGTRGAILNSGAPIRDEAGQVVGAVIAFLDVTEQRAIEGALQRSEAHLRLATESANLGTWEWDMTADRLYGNAMVADLFDVTDEDAAGGPIAAYLKAIHPDDLAHVQASIEKAIQNKGAYSARYRVTGRRGTRWVQTTGRVETDEDGQPHYFPGVVQDVTEQVAAEEALHDVNRTLEARVEERTAALAEANTALEGRNRELQEFAYVASHDLQEPLRKIQSFAGLLASDHAAALGDEGRFFLQRIDDAASRMSNLVRDLLALSRVATRAQDFRAVDLSKTLDTVMSDLELRLADTRGRVEVDGELPTILGDSMQMHQLLLNLVGNALKFVRPGVPPVVAVTVEDLGARVRMSVQDNGVGFEQKYAERIFAPFQRLHGRTEFEGTGMGLAIVRRIVERHGGTIEATSVPDAGSRFVVTLPKGDDGLSSETAAAQAPPGLDR